MRRNRYLRVAIPRLIRDALPGEGKMVGDTASETLASEPLKGGAARVSVVVPAYNAAATLDETLASLFAQTHRPYEIIVVDDGSTDRTADLLRAYGRDVVVVTKPNGGLASARNAGCGAATGDYIAFLDADDLAMPTRIELQAACLDSNPEVVLCFSEFSAFGDQSFEHYMRRYYSEVPRSPRDNVSFFGKAFVLETRDDGQTLQYRAHKGALFGKLAHGNFVHPPTVMFRRALFEEVGPFDTTLRFNCDWEWLVRAAKGRTFSFIDAPLVAYRISNFQMSSKGNRIATLAEILQVSERVCRLDPELFKSQERQFRSELFERCLLVADALAAEKQVLALTTLAKCFNYSGPHLAMLPVLAKIILPSSVTGLARRLKRTVRRSTPA